MHCLIIGTTGSGKTTLAKHLCGRFSNGSMVYDPIETSWPSDNVHASVEPFLSDFFASRSRHCFLDESLEIAGFHDRGVISTATRGRHYGHRCYYISQRVVGLSHTIRQQCSRLFLFAIPARDAAHLAEDFNDMDILRAPELEQLQIMYKERFQPVAIYRLQLGG